MPENIEMKVNRAIKVQKPKRQNVKKAGACNLKVTGSKRDRTPPKRLCNQNSNVIYAEEQVFNDFISKGLNKRVKKFVEKETTKKSKAKKENQKEEGGNNEPYFWPTYLHQEFMKQFSIYGKTWKMVSSSMEENGINEKD